MSRLLLISFIFGSICQAQNNLDKHLVINPHGHKSQIFDLAQDSDGNIVSGALDKRVYVWNKKTEQIEKMFLGQIGPGAEGMVYTLDVSPDNKFLAVGGWMGKDDESENLGDIRIYNYQTGVLRKRLKWHEDVVRSLRFTPDSRKLISADASGYIARWDLQTMWYDVIYERINPGLNNIAVSDDYFVSSHDDGMVYKWEYEKHKPAKKFNFFVKNTKDMVVKSEVAISDDGEHIAAIGKELGMILILNSKLSLEQHFFTGDNTIVDLDFAPSSKRLVVSVDAKNRNLVKVYDLVGKEWEQTCMQEFDDLIGCVYFVDEQEFITAGGKAESIQIHEIKNEKIHTKKSMQGVGKNYYSANLNDNEVAFSNFPTRAYGRSEYTKIFNLFERKEQLKGLNFDGFNYPDREVDNWRIWEYDYLRTDALDPSQILLIEQDKIIKDSILIHPWTGSQFYSYALINENLILIAAGGGILHAHDRKGKLLTRLVGHEGGLRSVSLSANGKFLVSSGVDQTIRFWPMAEIGKGDGVNEVLPTASMFMSIDNEWVLWNQDGYFTASKKGARYVGYHVNQGKSVEAKFYPFDQFDIKFNRPDILMEDLDMADEGLIELYHLAYLKRLKRLGLEESDLSGDIHAPEINEFETKEVDGQLKITIKAVDKIYPLDRLNVYLNDVPVLGRKGLKITDDQHEFEHDLSIDLISGVNKIEVSTLNSVGVESLRETAFVQYETEEKADLYMIGIGVSKYKDESFNLNYAAKDAGDMVDAFKDQSFYGTVKTQLLTDEEVTKENIFNLSAFLKDARPNDVVMIFIAGHGVLDASFDYFYCTHDMDFMDPASKGVSYAELENLFDGIKPIRKLLIMDTCHSGELFKDEVEEVVAEEQGDDEDIVFRSNAGLTTVRTRQGLQKTNEAVKEMFNDLNRGTGTTVISAAGGVEYAMESEEWKNGLFTYCFLDGLKGSKADLNNDKMVHLSELQAYIRDKVEVLSKGKQKPSSRFENLSLDYRIW